MLPSRFALVGGDCVRGHVRRFLDSYSAAQRRGILVQINPAAGLNVEYDLILEDGVCGEGCKDTRRQTRICRASIRTIAEFEDFNFSNPHFGSSMYITLLRPFSSSDTFNVVFSHGDLRPENITVHYENHKRYLISEILD